MKNSLSQNRKKIIVRRRYEPDTEFELTKRLMMIYLPWVAGLQSNKLIDGEIAEREIHAKSRGNNPSLHNKTT